MTRRTMRSTAHTISRMLGFRFAKRRPKLPQSPLANALTRELIPSIPPDQLQQIEHRLGPGTRGIGLKFLDLQRWMPNNAQRVIDLDLHKSSPKRILDLGCGPGYFMAVARHLGHDVVGLDLGDFEVFNELIKIQNLPRVVHRIQPFEPLPDLGAPFDLITGFMIRFNMRDDWSGHWDFDEWSYFIDDCRAHLKEGGQLHLKLNKGKVADYVFLSDDTAAKLGEMPDVAISRNKGLIRSFA